MVSLTLPKTSAISIALIVLIIQLFLLANADWIYGESASQIKNILNVYLIMQIAVMVFAGVSAKELKSPLPTHTQLFNAVVIFGIVGIFVTMVPFIGRLIVMGGILENLKIAVGYGLLHGSVIAFTEEIIFRKILPQMFMLGDIVASVLFGIFHLAVYHTNPFAVIFLMFLGFGFALIRDRFGLMGAVGAHTAWNFSALGVLNKIFLGV